MLFRNIKEFNIQYDEELRFVRVEWAAGRDMQRLRPALVQLQQLAKQLQVLTVLLDIDTVPDLSVFDQIWLATTWMPTVIQLPLKEVVVVLGSQRVYNQHAIEALMQGFRLLIKYDLQFFTQPLPGMQHLLSDSPRLPELLAEWQAGFGGSASSGPNPGFTLPQACLHSSPAVRAAEVSRIDLPITS